MESSRMKVRGLVLLSGVNPVPNFRGLVSCMTVDELNLPTVTNATQENSRPPIQEIPISKPASPTSEACIAPIVFVTSPGGSWFAVTGD